MDSESGEALQKGAIKMMLIRVPNEPQFVALSAAVVQEAVATFHSADCPPTRQLQEKIYSFPETDRGAFSHAI